jgi:hypothetical protein
MAEHLSDDITKLRALADRLDPDVLWQNLPAGEDDASVSEHLREVAARLERIATRGDMTAQDGVTETPMDYDADPPTE